MLQPTQPYTYEYRVVEEKFYEELFNSNSILTTYAKEIPQEKVDSLKSSQSKLARFRQSGLIGCLNDTGITSKNYKDEFYK